MATISRHRTATLTVDGQVVQIQVARLSLEAAEEYRSKLQALFGPGRSGDETLTGDDAAFVRRSIETYLSLKPDALTVDGEPVTTGAQLLEIIGENPALVTRALFVIAGRQGLSSDEGLPSASASVSVPPSDAHQPAPDGPSPETTVANVASAATAPTEAVTAETERPSSGSMEASS